MFFPPSHPVRYLLSAMSVLIILLLSTCLAAGVFLLYDDSVTSMKGLIMKYARCNGKSTGCKTTGTVKG